MSMVRKVSPLPYLVTEDAILGSGKYPLAAPVNP